MKNIHNKADYDEVVGRIVLLKSDSQRKWGIMTVEQMLAHCSDQIRLATSEKEPHEKPTFFPATSAGGFQRWVTTLRNVSVVGVLTEHSMKPDFK